MGRQQIGKNIVIDFPSDSPEWKRIRKAPQMVSLLDALGKETVAQCNAELRTAQAKRKQPVEDGYEYRVSEAGDRARLYIATSTARGAAHEAVNNAILKNMPIGNKPDAPAANRSVPRELAERSNEARQRRAVFLSHVAAFT